MSIEATSKGQYEFVCEPPCVGDEARKESLKNLNLVVPCRHSLCLTKFINGQKVDEASTKNSDSEPVLVQIISSAQKSPTISKP